MPTSVSVTDETKKWLRWVGLTPIPLFRLDDNELPAQIASGCLMTHGERRVILSALHATRVGEWVVEIRFDPIRKQTEVHRIGPQLTAVGYCDEHEIAESYDFSLTVIPDDIHPIMQLLDSRGNVIAEQRRHQFRSACIRQPAKDRIYAFSGRVRPCRDGTDYIAQPTVYPGLKYISTENGYHTFRLPVSHPGDDAFRGCSGSPVVDQDQHVVGLISDGNTTANTVRAVAIQEILDSMWDHLDAE